MEPSRRWVHAAALVRGDTIQWLRSDELSPVLSVRHHGTDVTVRHRDPDGEIYVRVWSGRRLVPMPLQPVAGGPV